jgi:flagellar basal-body rod protein FlgC
MDYLQSFAISAAGMAAERTRVEVAALNLANANTVLEAGQGYRPMRVLVHASASAATAAAFDALVGGGLQGPEVRVEATGREPRRVLEPGHPAADAAGFVAYPAVDATAEMVSMMTAMRAYEANVAAIDAARTVALKTLEIGG